MTEPNHFGTHEFIRFCRLCDVEPYFAANVGTGSPEEFQQWVEYCNAPPGSTTLADERAANGDREPLGVRYWGVGNESWGCGGKFTPEDYCREYRQVHRVAARLRREAFPDRRRAQRQRPRLDAAVLHEVGRRHAGSAFTAGRRTIIAARPATPSSSRPTSGTSSSSRPTGWRS